MVTPTAPMPAQTAYAVPTGRCRTTMASITKPATAATTQTTLHHNRVNPSDCLMASRPATVLHGLSN